MKINSKFTEMARRLFSLTHERYREMCSLAALGQLGGPQMCELNEHVTQCPACRKFFESIAQTSIQAMPVLAEGHVLSSNIAPPEGMRWRFLARLAAETNAKTTPFPVLVQQTLPDSLSKESASHPVARSLARFWRLTAIPALCAAAVVGFLVGHHAPKQMPQGIAQPQHMLAAVVPPNAPSENSQRINQLQQEKSALEAQIAQLKDHLALADSQQQALGEKLATVTAQYQAQSQDATQSNLLAKTQRMDILQNEIDTLRSQSNDVKTKLAAQQNENEELKAKLEQNEASLQQELSAKSAKGEMGQLVAARNLHIVDVYDADTSGSRKRSFGRVFYVEGKSLVFYAYDLEDPGHFKTNVVFHVWGGKAGIKEATHSMGILHKDDSTDSRWAMTFDDPHVLSQINSVFVTAESASKQSDEPHGKKVLYAFFGGLPNHP